MPILCCLFALLLGQSTPNFSGTWETVSIAPPPAAGATSLPRAPWTIVQSADRLVLTVTYFDTPTTTTYFFDGREDRNHSGAVTAVTRSRWDGTALVIEGKKSQVTSQGYAGWATRETFRLDAQGQLVRTLYSKGDDNSVFESVVTMKKVRGAK